MGKKEAKKDKGAAAEDWKAKLAQGFGREIPVEEKKEKNWVEEAVKFQKPTHGNNRNYVTRDNRQKYNRSGNQYAPVKRSNAPEMATAPYNFVSLPDKIVPAPLDQGLDWRGMDEKERIDRFKDYILQKGKLSGKLELELETVTPCFIGGHGATFYAPNGKPVIPGSTLRGLTKNLLKIITCGAMRRDEDFYDHHLYFRDIASTNINLKEYYGRRMVEKVSFTRKDGTEDSASRTKAEPGYLVRIKGQYFVYPAQAEAKDVKNPDERACIHWYSDGSADIITNPMRDKTNPDHDKKKFMHIKDPVWSNDKRLPVPPKVVEDYRNDKTRKGFDLLKNRFAKTGSYAGGFTHQKDADFVVPCYYVAQDGVVQHFGHGRYYRIPYLNSVGDKVPKYMQEKVIDFTDAMYGSQQLWGSRLFFEDAPLVKDAGALDKSYSHPLMSPNPTSYQLYLKQDVRPAKHWDEDTELRGYKLYWHQDIGKDDWKISEDDKLVKGMNEIQPLGSGNRFKGIIRFSNLSEVELGALCSLFHLEQEGEDIVFKIGQGKSIGMGSIRIKTKLFLENAEERYRQLFNGDAWNLGINETEDTVFCDKFAAYLDEALGGERRRFDIAMCELRTILNWNQTKSSDWKTKTSMMNPTKDKFDRRLKDRVILDDAIGFVNKRLKK